MNPLARHTRSAMILQWIVALPIIGLLITGSCFGTKVAEFRQPLHFKLGQ